MARSQKKITKAHQLRKRVKLEKARLRRRNRKAKTEVKYPCVITLTGMDEETISKLKAYAKKRHMQVSKCLRMILRKYMEAAIEEMRLQHGF
mgnify:CR=1 FL=1|nr:MAG TPA: plasmid partition protein ParG-helix-helix, dimer, DNA binding, CELL [Caudoviricetes sp.]